MTRRDAYQDVRRAFEDVTAAAMRRDRIVKDASAVLTTREMARAARVSPSTVNRIVNSGRTNVRP